MTSHQRDPGMAPATDARASVARSKVRDHAAERAGQAIPEGASDGTILGISRPPRPTTGGRILSVRVSREEAQALDEVMVMAGFSSRSEALRSMVRGAGGAVTPLPEETELLAGLARELHKIGVNVNQIALAANRRQIALMRAEWDAIAELRKLLPELRLAIGRLVGLRRHAGRSALASADAGSRSGTGREAGDA
jgi:Bacterial mobilisation protein (MobC)